MANNLAILRFQNKILFMMQEFHFKKHKIITINIGERIYGLSIFFSKKMTWNLEVIKANMVILRHVTVIYILITKQSLKVWQTCNVWQSKILSFVNSKRTLD